MLEQLIDGSLFGDSLDARGIPIATWIRERQEEGKGEHWICSTLHNSDVADYDTLCRAYAADFSEKRGPGRPKGSTKPTDQKKVAVEITLSPAALKYAEMQGNVSAYIDRLILADKGG